MEALVNWLWQGSVVALVATVALRMPRALGATARHRLWWVAMVIVLALPAMPHAWALGQTSHGTPILPATVFSFVETPAARFTVPAPPAWTARVLLAGWLAWVLLWSAQIAAALLALRRARRNLRPFPAEREARLKNWMALRTRGRRARLVESSDVTFAAVLGGRAPAIAVAPVVAAALDDRDLDRIVVHEWAHVQRRDDVGRVLQLAVRALVGLHPAVWWLDRQIHIDRETACDDWTVNLTGSARSYAASLTRLASLQAAASGQLLLPAALFTPELTRRVVRLLDGRRTTSTRRFGPVAAVMTAAVLAVAVASAGVRLVAVGTSVMADEQERVAPTASAPIAAAVISAPLVGEGASSGGRRAVPAPARLVRANDTQRQVELPGQSREPVSQPLPIAPPLTPPAVAVASEPGIPEVRVASELPGTHSPVPALPANRAGITPESGEAAPKSPWGVAADAGANVGRGSQKAAVATAGFFSKLGKSIARSF